MSSKVKGKFDKYWKDYNVVLAFGVSLHTIEDGLVKLLRQST